ncbi:MAG: hypothetical protein PHS04_06960 [Tissierellia bacterium]|nr:hypothetical protein [Tissierellia bacterium]
MDSYIAFWEMLWSSGGLKFEGTGHFVLPDLYIKAKRYDDKIMNSNHSVEEKR